MAATPRGTTRRMGKRRSKSKKPEKGGKKPAKKTVKEKLRDASLLGLREFADEVTAREIRENLSQGSLEEIEKLENELRRRITHYRIRWALRNEGSKTLREISEDLIKAGWLASYDTVRSINRREGIRSPQEALTVRALRTSKTSQKWRRDYLREKKGIEVFRPDLCKKLLATDNPAKRKELVMSLALTYQHLIEEYAKQERRKVKDPRFRNLVSMEDLVSEGLLSAFESIASLGLKHIRAGAKSRTSAMNGAVDKRFKRKIDSIIAEKKNWVAITKPIGELAFEELINPQEAVESGQFRKLLTQAQMKLVAELMEQTLTEREIELIKDRVFERRRWKEICRRRNISKTNGGLIIRQALAKLRRNFTVATERE